MVKLGRKNQALFGWLCSYTPVEIIMAAGLTPIRLDAGDLPMREVNSNIYQLICPYVRSVFDAAQKYAFGSLEGAVFMKCCDGMFRLYDLWRAHLPEHMAYILPLPKIQTPEAISYFRESLERFTENLAKDMGILVNEEDLKDAIIDLNRLRSAIQRLYRLRLANPQLMPYSKLHLLIRECLSLAPGIALPRVEKELEALGESSSQLSPIEAKALVTSSTLDQTGLIRLIEETGITVVGDDHCSGLRHFDDLVSEEGDVYFNLAKRYLKRWPCARMQSDPSHLQRLIQEVEAVDAKGVIYIGLKYCDQVSFDLPRLQEQLTERHIPLLYLENDYTEGGLGQLKVRIEAFAEMLKEEF